MTKVIFALVCAALSSAIAAGSSYSTDSLAVRDRLTAQGFNCAAAAPTPARGFRCRGRIPSYSQPINIYLPTGFSLATPLSLAYHFHGFWTSEDFNPFALSVGDYGAYLTASGKNALLIVPESSGKDETFASDLATSAQMNAFFINVDHVLAQAGVPARATTPRALSGHSGAYVHLGKMGDWAKSGAVPHLASTRAFALFDSAYGYRSGLVRILAVMRRQGPAFYFSAYNPDGGDGKRSTNLQIQQELGRPVTTSGRADIRFVQDSRSAHMEFMRAHMTEFFTAGLP